jgi:two-component system cell cycle sensor histidine kinase PleC
MRLANPKPLIVDERVTVAELGVTLALDWPDALRECFVVTRNGRYLGIGTCEAFVRCKVELLTLRESELKTALLRATDANQTKSNFLALMSHELRTPLNAIIGFSELLMTQSFGPIGNERYRGYAADIHGAGRHLLMLINEILDISKAEAGKLELHPEWIDVSALIDECLRLVSGRAHDQHILIGSSAPADLPPLYADPLRIKQILLNLLSNAVKFTPAGGSVEVTAELDSSGVLVLAVRDTGVGMHPESIPLALEPFRQIASPMSRNVEGTGLGLSLSKVLIEQHGGELDIESALNKGTKVSLRFPASRTGLHRAKIPA